MNFGGFATPERNLVFDINDFDETHPGPWEWDVKRLAASITVACPPSGLQSRAPTDEMVFNAIENYRSSMADFAEMGELDLWYEKMTFEYMLAARETRKVRKQIAKVHREGATANARKRSPEDGGKSKWQVDDTR